MSTTVTIRLLTIRQTAEVLGVSTKQVRRLIERGELPALQPGGPRHGIRIDQGQLEGWLETCRINPGREEP